MPEKSFFYKLPLICAFILLYFSPIVAEEVTVSTTQEFIDAIASNKTIRLAPGVYELLPELTSQSPAVSLAAVHDGSELVVSNIENLSIQGAGEDTTSIVTAATYAEVLIFRNVNNVTLRDLTLKHSVPGYCQSGVVTFENAEKVQLANVTLDGSGTTGLTLRDTKDVSLVDSTISNCTDSIVEFSYAQNVTLQSSTFTENTGGFNLRGSSGLLIRDSKVFNNRGHYELLRLFEGTELDIENSEFENNQMPKFSNREELLQVTGGRILNSGGFEAKWNTVAPQILQVGSFHGDEVWARSGESWLGLFKSDDGWELRDTIVYVERVYDAIADSKATQASGKLVSIDETDPPLFFVRGVAGLKEGRVETVASASEMYVGNNCGVAFYPGMSRRFSLGKRFYTVQASGQGELTKAVGEAQYQRMLLKNYRIQVSVREGRLVDRGELFVSEFIDDDAGAPGILWAGDLDRDGALDLLLSTSTHYNVSAMTLYLSSFSGSGLLPAKVAHFSSAGC
jgi:hypothetical protein